MNENDKGYGRTRKHLPELHLRQSAYGYYPIVCVHGNRSRNMYHDKTKCKHFEPCPEEVAESDDMDVDLCDLNNLKDFSATAE